MVALLAEGANGDSSLLQHLAAFTLADWTLAVVAALIAAVLLELAAMIKKAVTSRLPFLILRCTVVMMPFKEWRFFYHEVWEPDLHDILTSKGDEPSPGENIRRYLQALIFALGLVAGGAIRTRLQRRPKSRSRRVNSLAQLSAVAATAGTVTVSLVWSTKNEVLLGFILVGYGLVSLWVFARALMITRERWAKKSR
ncbi:hypothetical protein [Streptomyces sp. NPDC020983]|uniref:hypothetical protein n=1 Tax=Streptomyces sp. NPDC020983 TaxID=3365106 RepID=UPI0037A9E495